MELNKDPEAVNLNDADILHVDCYGGKDILVGFSNGVTIRLPAKLLKKVALVCAEEIVYPDGTTS